MLGDAGGHSATTDIAMMRESRTDVRQFSMGDDLRQRPAPKTFVGEHPNERHGRPKFGEICLRTLSSQNTLV